MYQKFIINQDGVLRFGNVYQHRELLRWDESCPDGGGLWKLDEGRRCVMLYGRSFAFEHPISVRYDASNGRAWAEHPCRCSTFRCGRKRMS